MIGPHSVFPELGASRVGWRVRGGLARGSGCAAGGPGVADMPRYAQLVMGPAGSGKVRIWQKKEGNIGVRGRPGVRLLRSDPETLGSSLLQPELLF